MAISRAIAGLIAAFAIRYLAGRLDYSALSNLLRILKNHFFKTSITSTSPCRSTAIHQKTHQNHSMQSNGSDGRGRGSGIGTAGDRLKVMGEMSHGRGAVPESEQPQQLNLCSRPASRSHLPPPSSEPVCGPVHNTGTPGNLVANGRLILGESLATTSLCRSSRLIAFLHLVDCGVQQLVSRIVRRVEKMNGVHVILMNSQARSTSSSLN